MGPVVLTLIDIQPITLLVPKMQLIDYCNWQQRVLWRLVGGRNDN